MDKNTVALFSEFNQSDKSTQQRSCTIMAPFIAINYNSKLDKKFTESDADVVIDKQIKNWKLRITWDNKGADVSDSILAVKQYIKETYKKDLKVKSFKSSDTEKLKYYLDLGYMVTIGIKVDKTFTDDVKDWKIDETNYFNFNNEKTIWHFTNIATWKGRFWKDCETLQDYNKTFIYDSYAFNKKDRAWLYMDVDLEQLKNISQKYFYVFYL